jgi:hypothetical protein
LMRKLSSKFRETSEHTGLGTINLASARALNADSREANIIDGTKNRMIVVFVIFTSRTVSRNPFPTIYILRSTADVNGGKKIRVCCCCGNWDSVYY